MTSKQSNSKQLLVALNAAKVARDLAEEAFRDAQKAVLEYLDETDQASLTVRMPNGGHPVNITGTKVVSTTLKIDENGLREEVGGPKWRTISKRVLDRSLLENAIVRDKFDPTILARYSDEVPRKPYVRLSTKEVK